MKLPTDRSFKKTKPKKQTKNNNPVKVRRLPALPPPPGLAELEVDVWIPELIPALSCPASEKPQGSRLLQRLGSPF